MQVTGGERRARKQVYSIIVGSMWRKGESSVLAKYNDTEDKSGTVIGSDGVDGTTSSNPQYNSWTNLSVGCVCLTKGNCIPTFTDGPAILAELGMSLHNVLFSHRRNTPRSLPLIPVRA